MKLDEIDKKLLNILQQNAKLTTKEIAFRLEIKRLEREEVISKYVALLDTEKINKNFLVFCHVKLIQHNKEHITKFEKEILKLDEVLECIHVSGDYDYILKIYVSNMKEYRNFLINKLTTIKVIASTRSTFMINQVKNNTAISLL